MKESGKVYRRHSALGNLLGTANYDIASAYVFSEENVSVEGRITYLPVYMIGLV